LQEVVRTVVRGEMHVKVDGVAKEVTKQPIQAEAAVAKQSAEQNVEPEELGEISALESGTGGDGMGWCEVR